MAEQFHRPTSPQEAVALAAKAEGRGVFLAGGTSFETSDYQNGLEVLIDVTALGLDAIEIDGDGLQLGAGCTMQQLLEAAAVYEPVKAALRQVGNRNIRNLATLGGQLGANEPMGDLLPVLIAMEASAHVLTDSGEQVLPVEAYLAQPPSGLVTRVVIPGPPTGRCTAVDGFALTAIDRSIVTLAVSLVRDGDAVRDPIVAVGGVADHVVRIGDVERALDGEPLPEREVLEHLVREHVSPGSDVRGSMEYRRHLAGVLCESALRRAYVEAAR